MFVSALFVLAAAVSAYAAPSSLVQRDVTDVDVLNFALTLEHLENAFYHEGLDKLNAKAFADAGYPPWVRARFEQIKVHEKTHVDFLTKALGDAAVKPCTYKFPYNDPKSFAALSMALETVGTSAYMGAAGLIQNKDTLTAAASILNVESRQAAWVGSAVLKGTPWDGPFETPLSPDGIFSLASQFIVSCPETNAKLPVNPLPKLAIEPGSPAAGQSVKFQYDAKEVRKDDAQLFVAFFDGLTVQYADFKNDRATVPKNLQGTVYAALVKEKSGSPTAQKLLTGLVMFEIGVPSYVANA